MTNETSTLAQLADEAARAAYAATQAAAGCEIGDEDKFRTAKLKEAAAWAATVHALAAAAGITQ